MDWKCACVPMSPSRTASPPAPMALSAAGGADTSTSDAFTVRSAVCNVISAAGSSESVLSCPRVLGGARREMERTGSLDMMRTVPLETRRCSRARDHHTGQKCLRQAAREKVEAADLRYRQNLSACEHASRRERRTKNE
eukprot:882937-Rhodomonas_salina.2